MMRRTIAGIAALALLLAGCTEIPTSSKPEVIGSAGRESPNPPPIPPVSGAEPREIVSTFIGANADSGDVNHTDARQYLTPSEKARWSDATVTVVGDNFVVGPAARNGAVTVDAAVLGTVDASGIYTPAPRGDGDGVPDTFQFQTKLIRVPHYAKPQWRIDKLPPGFGLFLPSLQFQQLFQQRAIYFFDPTERHLIPDPRYTSLLEPDALANWLVSILATVPPDPLDHVLPEQTDPGRVSVTLDADASQPAQILIPGATQLDKATRLNLAKEVAATLYQVASIGMTRKLMIVDGTTATPIPGFGTTFTASDFATDIAPDTPVPALYYVDTGGGVVSGSGVPLPGPVGAGYYDLTSVALASDPSGEGLLVAGTRLDHDVLRLDVGREDTPLRPVPKLKGALSRPEWAPHVAEVWIGAGAKLYRVSLSGGATPVPLAAANGQVAGKIVAVRLSPDGNRVALVLDSKDAHGRPVDQIWVGIVVRSSGDAVRVQGLRPITATGTIITDVGWNDPLKLFAIGHERDDGLAGIYEVQCDGSRWSAKGVAALPHEPTSLTVGGGQVAVVSAGGSIWEQNAETWQSPQAEEADGSAPIYVD